MSHESSNIGHYNNRKLANPGTIGTQFQETEENGNRNRNSLGQTSQALQNLSENHSSISPNRYTFFVVQDQIEPVEAPSETGIS